MKTNMIKMKIQALSIALLMLAISLPATAQDEVDESVVYLPFKSSQLIDQQTCVVPEKGTREFFILHRFTPINNGLDDIFGIYGGSNISMGMNWGLIEKGMVGLSLEKNNKVFDLHAKYNILQQTESNSMPIFLTAYFSMGTEWAKEEVYGNGYDFTDRLTYFSELSAGRKFSEDFSMMLGLNFSHMNQVDTTAGTFFAHDQLGAGLLGKYKVYEGIYTYNAICQVAMPMNLFDPYDETTSSQPVYGLGVEIGTSTHSFQIVASTGQSIIPQYNYLQNMSELDENGIMFGFNIVATLY